MENIQDASPLNKLRIQNPSTILHPNRCKHPLKPLISPLNQNPIPLLILRVFAYHLVCCHRGTQKAQYDISEAYYEAKPVHNSTPPQKLVEVTAVANKGEAGS